MNIVLSCSLQTKLAVLEQRLLKEEHERQLVQKKADRVSLPWWINRQIDINQRRVNWWFLTCHQLLEEMEASLHLPVQTTMEETKPKMRTKKTPKVVCFYARHYVFSVQHICDLTCFIPQKSESEMRSPIGARHQKIPFITGTVRTVLSNRLPNATL